MILRQIINWIYLDDDGEEDVSNIASEIHEICEKYERVYNDHILERLEKINFYLDDSAYLANVIQQPNPRIEQASYCSALHAFTNALASGSQSCFAKSLTTTRSS